MGRRGRPPGRSYTEKIEVWISERQLRELDAFCELHLGVKRAEVLRRSLDAFLKANLQSPAARAKFARLVTAQEKRSGRKQKLRVVLGHAGSRNHADNEQRP